jgi:hypothetical protein
MPARSPASAWSFAAVRCAAFRAADSCHRGSSARGYGAGGGRGSRSPPRDHRASHDAVELDRRVAHVRVVDPHHPLYGSCLLVSDRRFGRGPDLIVVRLPDGRERSIPRVATDLVARPAGPPQVTGRQKHISVRTLLPLANHVRAVLASHHEDPTGAPLLDRPPARSSHGEREREADGIAPPVGPTPDGEATATGAAGRPACKPPAAGVAPRSGGTSC